MAFDQSSEPGEAQPSGSAPQADGPAGEPAPVPQEPERRPWRPRDRGEEEGEGASGRPPGRSFKDGRPRFRGFYKRKVCKFCTKKIPLSYREADTLRRFITERGKILPRRITGTCPKHQRRLAKAIKQARVLALLPFVEK